MSCLGLVLGAAACGSPSQDRAATRGLTVPVATTLTTAAGTWATLAMGVPTNPLNTFWQLLFEPAGTTTWRDAVAVTGTATNGGLAVGTGPGDRLTVAVGPSQALTYSPVVTTTDGTGRTVDQPAPAVAPGAATLAGTPGGGAIAVTAAGRTVSTTASPATAPWHTVVGVGSAAGPVARCSPVSWSVVAQIGTTTLAGASCGRPGAVGLYVLDGSTLVALDPTLTLPGRARATVLWAGAGGSGVRAVVEEAGGSGPSLVAVTASLPGVAPVAAGVSAPLPLGGETVSSVAAGPSGPVVVYGPAAAPHLAELRASGTGWDRLPDPPVGTAVVAPLAAGAGLQALAATPPAKSVTLDVWTLAPGATAWDRGQELAVPVPFGSSG